MTRFEVVVTRRIREIHSITLDGLAGPPNPEVISESIEQVLCGWCGTGDSVSELGQTGAM